MWLCVDNLRINKFKTKYCKTTSNNLKSNIQILVFFTYNSAFWQWMSGDPDCFFGFIKVLEQGVADNVLSNGSGMNWYGIVNDFQLVKGNRNSQIDRRILWIKITLLRQGCTGGGAFGALTTVAWIRGQVCGFIDRVRLKTFITFQINSFHFSWLKMSCFLKSMLLLKFRIWWFKNILNLFNIERLLSLFALP